MAVSSMQKVMVVAHRSQATALVETLQDAGIIQILDAERAMVSKEWPELMVEARRHRELEETIDSLEKAIAFLKPYTVKEQTSLFAPYVEVDPGAYQEVISTEDSLKLLNEVNAVSGKMDKLATEADNQQALLDKLLPWQGLSVPVEELNVFSTSTTYVGLIPDQHYAAAMEKMAELGAAVEKVSSHHRMEAVLLVCLNESAGDVHKALRTVEFEPIGFEGLGGTVNENIEKISARLEAISQERLDLEQKAAELAENKLKLQILFDHYQNLYGRTHTESTAPATDHAIFFEGWVRKKDYPKLEKIVHQYDAADLAEITPGEDEETPVEIENGPAVKPFEFITRLYGMPAPTDVDPTAYLAPFFTIFFGVCLTDAAYGLFLVGVLWWVIKKFRGDKGPLKMFMICAVSTVIAGALTGGWCSDAVPALFAEKLPAIETFRQKIMLFDPMTDPMTFFVLAIGLGYIQIIFGLLIALYNNLRQKKYAAAVFEQVTWLLLLNSLVLFGFSKAGVLPKGIAGVFGWVAVVQAVLIFLFTERNSGLAGRIGGGVFGLFSAVFYFGDLLSYVRLMALGMVTAGLGMAVNILCKLLMDIPYVGFVLGAVLFVGGHLFNLAMSLLSSFVHSLRLQFVEFFPKFLAGGGKDFIPLKKKFVHIEIKKQ